MMTDHAASTESGAGAVFAADPGVGGRDRRARSPANADASTIAANAAPPRHRIVADEVGEQRRTALDDRDDRRDRSAADAGELDDPERDDVDPGKQEQSASDAVGVAAQCPGV